jgi:plasmid stability protein
MDTIDSVLQQEISLAAVTIRNLPDETHRALKLRAAQHGRSTEAEIRALEDAVRPKVRLGTALRALGRSVGGVDLKLERDRTPVAGAVLR